MTGSSLASRQPHYDTPETALAALQEEELRAIRALGILLESRLIDQIEYERRVATYQRADKAN
jgi:hypothetical protein